VSMNPKVKLAYDLIEHIKQQRDWSSKTFGPHNRWQGVVDHIRKELTEVEKDPSDIMEWIDIVILAIDGAWRQGYSPEEISGALSDKMMLNQHRNWPDWRSMPANKAIEHARGQAIEPEATRTVVTPITSAGF